ncbi:MAG: glycine cleavage system protein GcvH [Campylobacterota bacterium]|nr:glycine cleavage system protein GcvH [Campylobacterota bacterium]
MNKYNEEHEWVKVEDDVATVGISQYAIEQLGDITFIELPEVDAEIVTGDSVAFIESVKAASDIYAPVSGVVVEVNEDLLDAPELLNSDAEVIWVFKVKLSDTSELDSLMDANSYKQYIDTL